MQPEMCEDVRETVQRLERLHPPLIRTERGRMRAQTLAQRRIVGVARVGRRGQLRQAPQTAPQSAVRPSLE